MEIIITMVRPLHGLSSGMEIMEITNHQDLLSSLHGHNNGIETMVRLAEEAIRPMEVSVQLVRVASRLVVVGMGEGEVDLAAAAVAGVVAVEEVGGDLFKY